MADKRTEFERFADLAKAVVQVPKREALAAQPKATRPDKQVRRPKA